MNCIVECAQHKIDYEDNGTDPDRIDREKYSDQFGMSVFLF